MFTAFVCAFVFLWQGAVSIVENDYLLPPIGDIVKEIGRLFADKSFYLSFVATLERVLKAFLVSFALGLVFAVISYLLPTFGKIFSPIVSAMRSLPTMAIILILLVWSTPKKAPVIVAFLALFPMLYTGMISALLTVDQKLSAVCKVYQVPMKKRIFSMYVPIALPYVMREGVGALSFSLKLVVSAEVLANTYLSLGGMLQDSKIWMNMSQTFALTFIVVIVGLIFEWLGTMLSALVERRTK